ncbi:MAG: topoisomerase C-terminal repeat-containing protein, partial [Nocardioidaceae bacterium]
YGFTAMMEGVLDAVARGEEDRLEVLRGFYFGGEGDDEAGDTALKTLVSELGEIDARGLSTFEIGDGINARVGRYGPYVEGPGPDGEPARANIPEDLPPDELTSDKAKELLANPAGAETDLGTHPETGRRIVAKNGRYGPYVTEQLPEDAAATPAKGKSSKNKVKPRTASLFKSMSLETITLDDAVKLLTLPRVVGVDPESGEEITAQNGRYGPYLKKGTDSRSIGSEEQLLTMTLDEALAVYAQPKQHGRRAAATALKELGNDPVSDKPVVVKDGRFGPYVTDGEYNATLRKGDDPEAVTLERAAELLAEKRAKGPVKKKAPARKKSTAKKSTAKNKAPAKKSTAKKKSPAEKS